MFSMHHAWHVVCVGSCMHCTLPQCSCGTLTWSKSAVAEGATQSCWTFLLLFANRGGGMCAFAFSRRLMLSFSPALIALEW